MARRDSEPESRRERVHTSGLVFRSPVTRSPGFHWARFLRISMRSKRFRTFRLAPEVLAARRLECCDIKYLLDTVFAYRLSAESEGGFSMTLRIMPMLILLLSGARLALRLLRFG